TRLCFGLLEILHGRFAGLGSGFERLRSFGSRVLHALGRLLGNLVDLTLLGSHLLGGFGIETLVGGGFLRSRGDFAFGRRGAFERFGSTGEFTDLHGRRTTLGVGDGGFDLGGGAIERGFGLLGSLL